MPNETNTLRQEISDTREDLGENITQLESRLKENWQNVKREFSPVYQTRQHPWLAVGASVVAGAAAGGLLARAIDGGALKKENFAGALSYFSKFSDEYEMAKSQLLAAGIRRLASTVKENFPEAIEAVDKVMTSALSKIDLTKQAGSGETKKQFH
jgi:hypothetical protein